MLKNRKLKNDMRPYVDILYNFARYHRAGENITIFEIGVRRGISTLAFLRGLDKRLETIPPDEGRGFLYSIDIDDRSDAIRTKSYQYLKKNWEFILGDSTKIVWDKEIDILFIDGNHTYEYCKADYEKYEPFVKEGGFIFLHDVLFPRYGVKDYWKEIKYSKIILPFNKSGLGIVYKNNGVSS